VSGRIGLVAALDRDRAIGRGNALPWRLPEDIKRFKALTLGKPVLMGRKTAESLGRALPGRRNLVLTRSGRVPFAGMEPVASLDEALAIAGDAQLMVIGGGEIYALALPLATTMHLTHVDTMVVAAEAFFPAYDSTQWQAGFHEAHAPDDRHAFGFEFVDYTRR
jgi:dihydrofolate reductase